MLTLRRSAWIRWLPPIESASPSPVTTHTDRSGPRRRQPGRDRRRAAVDRVHPVRLHVVREARGAADPGDEDDVLARDPELGHEALHRGEDRVVAAARAPAHLLVGLEVLRVSCTSPLPSLTPLLVPSLEVAVRLRHQQLQLLARALRRGGEKVLGELPGDHGHAPALPEDRHRAVAPLPERERLSFSSTPRLSVSSSASRLHQRRRSPRRSRDAVNGSAAHEVVADRVDEELGAHELEQLAEVHLRDQHLLVARAAPRPCCAGTGSGSGGARARRLRRSPHAPDRGADRAVRRRPSRARAVSRAVRVVHLELGDVARDPGHLRARSRTIRSWLSGSYEIVAGAVCLLQPADPVLEAGRAGHRPRPRQRLGVARVGQELVSAVRRGRELASRCRAASTRRGSATAPSRSRGTRRESR